VPFLPLVKDVLASIKFEINKKYKHVSACMAAKRKVQHVKPVVSRVGKKCTVSPGEKVHKKKT